jgi:hypothetical protein
MESLVSFLSAASEAYEFEMRTGITSENRDLFSNPAVAAWAFQNADAPSVAAIDLGTGQEL